ncbi:Digestive cysteine proteinase 3 [Halotydeus destructor]|nr:Digestive cysteine proteinase 3 [Halotydeus destructor]
MRALIVLSLPLIAVCLIQDPEIPRWLSFKEANNRNYEPEEEVKRFAIFKDNLRLIDDHNRLFVDGLTSFYLKATRFADMTAEEVRQYKGYKVGQRRPTKSQYDADDSPLPASVDWRDKGLVTPIKDQGACGSCWAFSAIGSLEGQQAKSSGKLVSLSEQNLVDCSAWQGNEGCDGGWTDWAFDYVKQNGGLDTEASYPYEAEDGVCRYNKTSIGAVMKDYVDIDHGNEMALQSAVANIGPVSVAIDASSNYFSLYGGGVYNHGDCGNTHDDLDHGVTVVGYGTTNGQDYYIVKNSWGTDWGTAGYMQLARNDGNLCGIATQAAYPVL